MKQIFEIEDFEVGRTYEVWVRERVDGIIGKSLLHTIQRKGDTLTDEMLDTEYTIDELNESLNNGEEWSKREYKNYVAISYDLVVV